MPGKPAARAADPTAHGSPLGPGPGSPDVLIGGLPAWRAGVDQHACPAVSASGPDGIGSVSVGSPSVWINGQMACRAGDAVVEKPGAALGPMNPIAMGCPTVLIGESGVGAALGPGPVSLQAAAETFALMAAQPDIAFKFPVDGCYARAHLMVQRMQTMGLTPGKAWTFQSPGDPLWVNTPNHPRGRVAWGYHVAPTLPVQDEDGKAQDMVIDPSIFDRPVTVEEWKEAQHDRPTVVQTEPGEAPLGVRGSGYWPGGDPAEGPDRHARKMMRYYKRYEGTAGPLS